MKSQLFKIAHAIKSEFNSWSEALRHAWKVIKLKLAMKKGEVSFKFKKIDGTIREGLGTSVNIGPKEGTKPKKENHSVIPYFDMQKGEYRSFKAVNLI